MLARAADSRFPGTKGAGKEVTIRADSQQKDKDTYHLRGHVQIVYEDMRVTADEASFDAASGDVMARGHVVFDDPKSHLVAEEVHYNIQTQKGWFSNGVGYVHSKGPPRPRVLKTENPFYIWGETVDRLDEDTYLVNHGSMTTCDCAKKGWLLSVGKARVTPGEKVVAHDAVFTLPRGSHLLFSHRGGFHCARAPANRLSASPHRQLLAERLHLWGRIFLGNKPQR